MEKVSMIKAINPFSSIPPLFLDLEKSLSGEIECSHAILEKYSIDFSPYFVKPQAIIYPKNVTDIKHAIAFAREYSMPITVRGNGRSETGGSLGEGLIIDMSRYFNTIHHINMRDHTITVDAGVSVKRLREKLHGWGMDTPTLTSQDNDATIGAILATKSVTPSSFLYGSIREWVEAMTIVLDTGEEHRIADGITPSGRLLEIYQSMFPFLTKEEPILRALKPENIEDVTGYSLWNTSIGPRQLINQIIGSEGTLGIITTVTLLVKPYEEKTVSLFIPVPEKESISLYVEIAKHHKAEHLFLYDSTFMELVERYRPKSCPSFKEESYSLCVSFSGNSQEEIDTNVRRYVHALNINSNDLYYDYSKKIVEEISEPTFLLSLLDSYTQESLTPITVGDGIIVPHHLYTKALTDIENYLYSTGKLYTITGNVGSGHISAVILFDQKSPTYEKELETYTQTLFSCVKKYKGGISAQGGEGIARTPYISFIFNEAAIVIFTEVKKIWDPLFVFNPGKKLGTTLAYLQNHISHTKKKL